MSQSIQPPFSPRIDAVNKREAKASDLIAKVKPYTEELIKSGLFSGGVTIYEGTEQIVDAYCSNDQTQFDRHTLFNSCSVSKLFTAIAIHQLDQSGKIKLSDTLGALGLKNLPKGMDDIEISELLNHTSGIIDGPKLERNLAERGKFNYSNYGYQLLAEVVGLKSPYKSFHQHVKHEIIERAHMDDANQMLAQFDPSLPNVASPKDFAKFEHLLVKEKIIQHFEPRLLGAPKPVSNDVTPPAGNGCFYVSNDDWIKFSLALQNGTWPMGPLCVLGAINPHEPDELYCAGFEEKKYKTDTVHFRNGNSLGASSAFKIIERPNKEPVTIVVNSNLGQARGNIVADELLSLVEGEDIKIPLARIKR